MGAGLSRILRRFLSNPDDPNGMELAILASLDLNAERLDFRNHGLRTLPEQIFQLENLAWAQFSQNQIEHLPPEIANFKNLKMMRLFSNMLRGFPPEIGALQQLTTLDVGKNQLETLCSEIGNCVALTELNLQWNQITFLPPEIGNLVHLRILNLYINRLSHLPPTMTHLVNLESLDLAHNQIKELPGILGSFPHLTSLNLVGNGFSALPEELGALSNLRKFDVRCNYLSSLPSGVCELPIKQFFARGNRLIELPENFGNLRQLTDCRLESNQLTKLPDSIGDCENLKIFLVYDNMLTYIPESLGKITGLVELDLSTNLLHTLPDQLGSLASLEALFLAKNEFESLPLCIGELASLTDLELVDNRISQLPGEVFVALQKLGKLNINKNRLEGLPGELFQCKSLMILELCCNHLEFLPEQISELESLTFLNVSFNLLTELPASIGTMHQLQKIYLSSNRLENFHWPDFSTLSMLEEFCCACNGLSEVPPFLYKIPALKYLDLSGNQIQEISAQIRFLTNLNCLIFAGNRLHTLPPEIGTLVNLTDMDFSLNQIKNIHEEISTLVALADVDFSGNQLETLPNDLRALTNLLQFKLAHNRLSTLPKFDSPNCWVSKEGNPFGHQLKKLKYQSEYESVFRKKRSGGSRASPDKNMNLLIPGDLKYTFDFGWSELRGRRPDQQDTLAIIHNPSGILDTHYIGLFDGHGGTVSAEVAASVLHHIVLERFINSHCNLDEMQQIFSSSLHFLQGEFQNRGVSDGSAVNIVFLTSSSIFVANAGDSRCVLIRQDPHNDRFVAVALSQDHKPESQEERDRIEALGGFVTESKRVNGVLALSRALGDCDLQPPITCEPVVTRTEITPDDKYIILGCDGLWDMVSNEQAAEIVKQANSATEAALLLRECSYCLGSTDNISVVVIAIRPA